MINIEVMREEHKSTVLDMMRVFYASPAVITNGSEEIFNNDVDACIGADPYLDGYVFEDKGEIVGYAMTAKSYSTEYGRPCVWIEDIYLKESRRGQGIGTRFFKYLEEKHAGAILRLEAEADNARALQAYRKNGFDVMPYVEMKKLI